MKYLLTPKNDKLINVYVAYELDNWQNNLSNSLTRKQFLVLSN